VTAPRSSRASKRSPAPTGRTPSSTRRFSSWRPWALVLAGWGATQYPYLISPDLTIRGAAAPDSTLRPLTAALLLGALVLLPSMYGLFKGRTAFAPTEEDTHGS